MLPNSDATLNDLAPMRDSLRLYAEIYARHCPECAAEQYIDGTPQNIEDAGWLIYEGTTAWFPDGMIHAIAPWLTMNVLVASHDCRWIVTEHNQIGVKHALLKDLITRESLNKGSWLRDYDYDEAPADGEIALDSYSDILSLLARKRIHGARPMN